MSKSKKIYYDSFEDAIERNRKKVTEIDKKLNDMSKNIYGELLK